MTDAIENVYILLLGQIALITSAILFSLPRIFFYSKTTIDIGKYEWFFFISVFFISITMIFNLIIGWAALRDFIKEKNSYNMRMFIIDLVIVVVLFFMNNILMFSFKGEINIQSSSVIEATIKQHIPLENVSIMNAFISLFTGIFLLLCKMWNVYYYKIKEIDNSKSYETKLTFVIVLVFILSLIGFVFNYIFWIQIVLLILLLGAWLFINFQWLKDKLFK